MTASRLTCRTVEQSVLYSLVCLFIYSIVPLKEKIVLLAHIFCDIILNVSFLFLFLADVAVWRQSRTQCSGSDDGAASRN